MRRLELFFGLKSPSPRWTAALARLVPRPDEIRLICTVLLLGVVAANAASWVTGFINGKTVDGRPAGADFIAFYNGGRILNEFGGERLYDLTLQDRLYRQTHPWDTQKTMWYVNAPFLAQAFRPLASVPYAWACVAWSILSAGFYLAAVRLVWPAGLPLRLSSPLLLAVVSFPPFAIEAWTGGQLSPLTALVLASAFSLYRRGQCFVSGAVLALCLYKPTIGLPLVALAALAAEWRLVAGYALGAAGLGLASLATVGTAGMAAFLNTMLMYGRFTATGDNPLSVEHKCIDLNHLARSLTGGHAGAATLLFALAAAAVFLFLAAQWRRAQAAGRGAAMWAAGITSTLLLNLYAPIYDATLLAVSGLITAEAALRRPELRPGLLSLAALLYAGALIAAPIGKAIGIQPYTLVVAAFAAFQLAAAGTATRETERARAAEAG